MGKEKAMVRRTIHGMTVSWRHGWVLLSMLMMVLAAACQQQSTPAADDRESAGDLEFADDLESEVASPPTTSCSGDDDCLDGNPETIDWCYGGDCHHEYRGECESYCCSCYSGDSCSDSQNSTLDWCYHRSCHHVYRDSGHCAYCIIE